MREQSTPALLPKSDAMRSARKSRFAFLSDQRQTKKKRFRPACTRPGLKNRAGQRNAGRTDVSGTATVATRRLHTALSKVPTALELHRGKPKVLSVHCIGNLNSTVVGWLRPRQRPFKPDWKMGSRLARQVLTDPLVSRPVRGY